MGSAAEEFGPYVVYEQIGLGGMATVHRAEQPGISGFTKQIALKRMLPSVAIDASLVKSFIREARLASHLRHANVAQTYDLGKVGETYFIAMELVPGRNLREILKHCAHVAGNVPLPIAMNIVNQICDALDYAHNLCDESGQPLGIIHRDVSPSNIIVSVGGVVKLIDFGIAKATGQGMTTKSGTIKGKFSYMAPESLVGSVDARADLFSLGVIAYEVLTNRPLFQGTDDMDTLFRVRQMKVEPPSTKNPQVPPEIDTIVMTALERDPEERWQRATALRTALTTETKRLGLIAHNTEVIDWIDWAFRQTDKRGDEESLVISIDRMQTGPSDVVTRPIASDSLARLIRSSTMSDTVETIVRPSSSQPLQPHGSRELEVPTLIEPHRMMPEWSSSGFAQIPTPWSVDTTAETMMTPPSAQIAMASSAEAEVETPKQRPSVQLSATWSGEHDAETREVQPLVEPYSLPRPSASQPPLSTRPSQPSPPLTRPPPRNTPSQPPLTGPPPRNTPSPPPPPRKTPSQPPPPLTSQPPSQLPRTPPSQPPLTQSKRASQPPSTIPNPQPPPPLTSPPPHRNAASQPIASQPPPKRPGQPLPPLTSPPPRNTPSQPPPHLTSPPPRKTPSQPPPPLTSPPLPNAPRQRPSVAPPSELQRPSATNIDPAASGALTLPHGSHLPARGSAPSGRWTERNNAAAPPTNVQTRIAQRPSKASNFLLAVLVLIVAGGAAAVVYFALPYFT